MSALIAVLVIALVVAICFWIIRQVPFPPNLEMVRWILMVVIALLAIWKLLSYLGPLPA